MSNGAPNTFQRVLVGIDFSADSLSALQLAHARFADPTATLVLVHAADAAEDLSDYADLRGQVVSAQAGDVQRQLLTLAAAHRTGWQDVQTVLELGKPVDVILAAAHTWRADLVVLGSHGKTSLTRTLFGGTTYSVARKVSCSVLVLRAGQVA
ncbi:universal stress protein [Aquabacterium humicola]|uniref:universal stress protein n=1 Tax=Aquabacterium humicola TaxID=3237377 RepID=UPI0025436459|nr:universal stress protein [Rubrivivax pictus]